VWPTQIPTRRHLLKGALALAAGKLCSGVPLSAYPAAKTVSGAEGGQAFGPNALPSRADVVMSLRTRHPEGLQRLQEFHATRNEWVYTTDAGYVAEMKKTVSHVGLAVNLIKRVANDSGAAYDVDGGMIVAPWMRGPGNNTPWNSIFKSASRDAFGKSLDDSVRAGADSIQFDDPATDYELINFAGGDFSPEAIAAFKSYCQTATNSKACGELNAHGHNIADWVRQRAGNGSHVDWVEFKKQYGSEPVWREWDSFLKYSSKGFMGSVRQHLHTLPRPIPLSANVNNPLPRPDFTFLFDSTDYLISEIYNVHSAGQLKAYHACAAAWQLPLIPSFVPVSTGITQWSIALGYALGDTPLVPWDVFVPGKERYFGSVADHGHLFDFVRANAARFTDYEEFADVALIVDENTANVNSLHLAGTKCVELGASFRMVVLRPDGTVTQSQQMHFSPAVAVTVDCSPSVAKKLFPSIPTISSDDWNSNHPALKRIIRTVSLDHQRIVAVPRINPKNNSLIVHVVDAREAESTLGDEQFVDLILPPSYQGSVQQVQHALMIGPRGASASQAVSWRRDKENLIARVPLAGLTRWGIVMFDNHMT